MWCAINHNPAVESHFIIIIIKSHVISSSFCFHILCLVQQKFGAGHFAYFSQNIFLGCNIVIKVLGTYSKNLNVATFRTSVSLRCLFDNVFSLRGSPLFICSISKMEDEVFCVKSHTLCNTKYVFKFLSESDRLVF